MDTSAKFSRRGFLVAVSAAAGAAALRRVHAAPEAPRAVGLGFSLYGMKSMSLEDALKTCAAIGYDCVELPVMVDWPGDSAQLSAATRREIRAQLAERELRLSALMENLPCYPLRQQSINLDRLKRACELANELVVRSRAGEDPPILETILGGKVGEFDEVKDGFVERLQAWAEVLADAKVLLAIKAHVGNATQQPQQLLWLLDKVASPWLVAAYDYSHFQLQDLKMTDTMDALLPRARFIHVKDTEHALGKRGFLLPGEGSINYDEYFKLLAKSEYRGDVVVEVSGQVFSKPGYDPVLAAHKCYNHLAPAMKAAGITRV
jgi:inosose dehydratase